MDQQQQGHRRRLESLPPGVHAVFLHVDHEPLLVAHYPLHIPFQDSLHFRGADIVPRLSQDPLVLKLSVCIKCDTLSRSNCFCVRQARLFRSKNRACQALERGRDYRREALLWGEIERGQRKLGNRRDWSKHRRLRGSHGSGFPGRMKVAGRWRTLPRTGRRGLGFPCLLKRNP